MKENGTMLKAKKGHGGGDSCKYVVYEEVSTTVVGLNLAYIYIHIHIESHTTVGSSHLSKCEQ